MSNGWPVRGGSAGGIDWGTQQAVTSTSHVSRIAADLVVLFSGAFAA